MLIEKKIEDYITEHSSSEDGALKALDRATHLHVLMPHMISGHPQGLLLTMLTQMLSPKTILEIGTFTGYSAICMARGLQPDGLLYTIDKNEELQPIVEKHVAEAGLSEKIKPMFGNAMEIIPTIESLFDMVFIDADKQNYSNYYQLVVDKVTSGGLIVADNVLWKGKVADEEMKDKSTRAIRDFNKMVQEDERVTNTILPVRDGLMIARKN
ncbi:O-methyltransferase [Flammeovirgaceae bacterium SG7u.111]|nr:O-methyltransferase [Flammeovirgaceae bacterium SG7u.132]WPO34880.1 O-methyltransferase [Flammeovirgaceae bacterium SG7u.111]